MRGLSRQVSAKTLDIFLIFNVNIVSYMMKNSRGILFTCLRKGAQLLLNKYILAMSIFVVWLLFFDKNSIVTQWSLRQTIHQLEDEKAYLYEEMELTKEMKEDLSQNREKYAREKFFMKKPGERVFIIE